MVSLIEFKVTVVLFNMPIQLTRRFSDWVTPYKRDEYGAKDERKMNITLHPMKNIRKYKVINFNRF